MKPKDLFDDYILYCKGNNISRVHSKGDFITKLSDVNINYMKTSGNHYYKLTYDELKKIADKQKWIHTLDEEEEEDNNNSNNDDVMKIDYENDEYVISLLEKIKELEKKLEDKNNAVVKENYESDDDAYNCLNAHF
jgi:hypothetical protein